VPVRSKKRKLEASADDASTKKSLQQTQKAVVKDAATVMKELLALCSRRAEDLLTRRVNDRRAGLKALVTQFTQFHKHLGAVPSDLEADASDILSKVVSMAVNVMTKEGMEFKRHWVRQFQSAVGDVRAAFDTFACLIEP
jgi:deferrochelatase/peroxidase EfeB